MGTPPVLTGQALKAAQHRGSHVQIIAAAGSGKTEVVSQRVASLLAEGARPDSIVAFTFTERAAAELKERIKQRAQDLIGPEAVDLLGPMFVGTIHSFCFRLLQQRVPRYETYDVLDDNQLTAFLAREANRLKLRQLDPGNRLFASIELFFKGADVVENELLSPQSLTEPFHTIYDDYLASLERYRLLTFGQQVVRAVFELEDRALASSVHARLRHLIVDEYQDVNPAQERLIELLAGPKVELCVVGDDDQAIYQWRGSDVSNIVTFAKRYRNVAQFTIRVNRRSRPTIIETANIFARSIPGRLAKTMKPHRPASREGAEVSVWSSEMEVDEAANVTNLILDLADVGIPYRDIAVLVRSSTAYRRLVEQFGAFDVPVQPGGRTGLFDQPEARVLGRTFAWMTDIDWREQYQRGEKVTETHLLAEYRHAFGLTDRQRNRLRRVLREWRGEARSKTRTANLVGEFYELMDVLDVRSWDLTDRLSLNRIGTLARFTSLLADYETVRRRARPDAATPGEQVGGEDRGEWYYKNLAIHIVNFAAGVYEGFDGEPDYDLDAVDLTTVHRSKGLEWPVVFLPSVTGRRFPSQKTGNLQEWPIDRRSFPAARYEGSDADERRLFYVGLTRARDWVSVSAHDRVNVQAIGPSPYWYELGEHHVEADKIHLSEVEPVSSPDQPIGITYSELAMYLDCAYAFRLRNQIGFQPRLAPELGYGKSVHHVLRRVAEHTQENGKVPTPRQIDGLLDDNFFLPTANKPAHRQLKDAARNLINEYTKNHADDLYRIWETERPFELHLEGVVVSGRADVILDREGGEPTALAILDYKTSRKKGKHEGLQLQVYADAGRREGLDVRAGYIHELKTGTRQTVDVTATGVQTAESIVTAAATRLRGRDFSPNPGPQCQSCEVRTICPHAPR